jgi:hypothetical protein
LAGVNKSRSGGAVSYGGTVEAKKMNHPTGSFGGKGKQYGQSISLLIIPVVPYQEAIQMRGAGIREIIRKM